jgi:hypothetical protein
MGQMKPWKLTTENICEIIVNLWSYDEGTGLYELDNVLDHIYLLFLKS